MRRQSDGLMLAGGGREKKQGKDVLAAGGEPLVGRSGACVGGF